MQPKKFLMKLKNIVILTLILSSIAGCSSLRTIFTSGVTVDDNEAMVCRVPYDFRAPTPINMRDVKFYALTPEIMKEIVEGNPNDLPTVYIALTTEGYEKMSYNMVEITNYVKSNKTLLKEIRLYYSKQSDNEERD